MSEEKKFKAGKRGLVYGVGINDADYLTVVYEERGDDSRLKSGNKRRKLKWMCPYYARWHSMMERCYSKPLHKTHAKYSDCEVCDEWVYFSKFKAWMQAQEYEGLELDKDLLVKGNRVYSPETCVFVSPQVNGFIKEMDSTRGCLPIGVSLDKRHSTLKYIATCRDPFTKKKEQLGTFACQWEAHEAWLSKKLEHAYALAAIQTDQRVAIALIERYENYTLS